MSQVEIVGMAELLWEERQEQERHQGRHQAIVDGTMEASVSERRRIDLSTAVQILSQKGYANRSEEEETQMYFRIFDGGNKGYITLEDLKRVQNEVKEAEREMNISSTGDVGIVGDATLQAMMDQFDHNGDGVIDYEEFRNIKKFLPAPYMRYYCLDDL